jgi:phosphonate transport system substrate-binding protein
VLSAKIGLGKNNIEWAKLRNAFHPIMKRYIILFIALFVGLACSVKGKAEQRNGASDILRFGVVPQQSATKLAKRWVPLLNYLSEKTGYTIHFETAKDIPTFEQRCANGEYDLAYMNPYHYVVFHENPGYKAVAKENLKYLKGIIVVRNESPFENLANLDKSELAFPAPAAFAASIITQANLKEQGIQYTARYVLSHDSVYRAVAKGLFAGGGGVPRTFNNIDPEIRSQLRVLWTSKGYSPHAIAAHPKVSEEVVMRILHSMKTMHLDPQGRQILNNLTFKGIVEADNKEWEEIHALRSEYLDDLINE